jgi:N-acetyltransferase 10
VSQALALFAKIVRKVSKRLYDIQKEAFNATILDASDSHNDRDAADGEGPRSAATAATWRPIDTGLEEELDEAGNAETRALHEKQRALIDSLDLSRCVQSPCITLRDIHMLIQT